MKGILKRITALLLVFTMTTSLLYANAWAAEPDAAGVPGAAAAVEAQESGAPRNVNTAEVRTATETYINPLYADVISEDDLLRSNSNGNNGVAVCDDTEPDYLTSVEEAGAQMREAMKNREESVVIYFQADEYSSDLIYEISDQAMIHTGEPTEGDYLKWQYGGWSTSTSYYTQNSICYMTITYTITYYTTSEQEAEMDGAVSDLLEELDVADQADYDKIRAVYDYICAHTTYDYDNLNDDDYKLKYTAYAALINGTAVCQGYALLFYRLALELDVDARLISGIGNGGAHGWNIVELEDEYYNVDSTWDAGETVYSYFLKCDANFTDHVRDDEYATEEFYAAYPMGTEDYQAPVSGTCGDHLTWSLSHKGTLTISGTGEMADNVTSWDDYRADILAVQMNDGITSVGASAFHSCINLTSVDLPDSLTSVGTEAFIGCTSLTSVTIPASVTSIGEKAFGYDNSANQQGDGKIDGFTISGYTGTAAETYAVENGFAFIALDPPVDLDTPEITSVYSTLQDSAKVTWTPVEDAEGYELYRALDPDTDPEQLSTDPADEANGKWIRVKTITSDNTQYTADGKLYYRNQNLTIGQTYYYMVRAYAQDKTGEKVYSDFSNIKYMPAAVVFERVYSNSTERIRLLWNQVGGSHGYQIWRQNEDGTWSIVKTLGDKGNTLTNDQGATTVYSNTGLEAGKTYTYKMRAFSIVEDGVKVFGAYSDEVTVAVMPEAPTLNGTSSKAGRADLTWNAVNGAAGYQLWMATSKNGTYSIAKSITDGSTSYTKYDLTSGSTYYFKMRAYTEVDGKMTFGAYSEVVSVTVK